MDVDQATCWLSWLYWGPFWATMLGAALCNVLSRWTWSEEDLLIFLICPVVALVWPLAWLCLAVEVAKAASAGFLRRPAGPKKDPRMRET